MAKRLTRDDDKAAMELLAMAWDKAADARERDLELKSR
jgi:hypothetical protein